MDEEGDKPTMLEINAKPSNYQKVIQFLVNFRNAPFVFISNHPKEMKMAIQILIFFAYNAYLIGCIWRHATNDDLEEWEWCDGIGFLIIVTGIVYTSMFYFIIIKPIMMSEKFQKVSKSLGKH